MGGSKAVYKLYKKTEEMVKGAFPKAEMTNVQIYISVLFFVYSDNQRPRICVGYIFISIVKIDISLSERNLHWQSNS